MPSTNKTDIGLNQWITTDKPLMEDFNADNRITTQELEKKLGGEIGEFEPELNNGVSTKGVGNYTLIGKRFLFDIYFQSAPKGTGGITITGIPYAPYNSGYSIPCFVTGKGLMEFSSSNGNIYDPAVANKRVTYEDITASAVFIRMQGMYLIV